MKKKDKELLRAVQSGELDDVLQLLGPKANVNAVDDLYKKSLLHYICYDGHTEILEVFLNRPEIDINIIDMFGRSALHYAIQNGRLSAAKMLLEHGANPNITSISGVTPIHIAIERGNQEATALLIKYGANIHAITEDDEYSDVSFDAPIHLAARYGNLHIVELLVKQGADIAIPRHDGQTPRMLFHSRYASKIKEFDAVVTKAKVERNGKLKAELADSALAATDELATDSNSHHKSISSVAHSNKKRKPSSNDLVDLKKAKSITADEEDEYSDTSGDEEDSLPSSSSSNSSFSLSLSLDSSGNEGSSRVYSAESNLHSSSTEQSVSYEDKQSFLQIGNSQDDTATAENLLMVLFPWIKDLPQELQQQILSSFIIQRVLEMLEGITHPDKFITDQLNNQSAEERFATDHTKYYGQDELHQSNAQVDAQVKQDDSFIFQNEGTGTISCDGILIDPLLKYDINFGMPHLFGGLAS
jgi:hypothetical protein